MSGEGPPDLGPCLFCGDHRLMQQLVASICSSMRPVSEYLTKSAIDMP